ncbi:hypothetical protein TcBrA4_0018220 [Trypanosoma cruzi]|nr:hypothetical protein TcBrA4_0018220 [Trypanosoma cruzi]
MVLHSADRFRAAAAPHVVVYVFVSNYEWRESETLSFNVCLRVHHTGRAKQRVLNYPLLGGISQALAHNGAALGGSFSSGCCTTRCGLCFFSNYEWRESEVLHSADVFERLLHHTLWSIFVSNYEWRE